MLSILIPIYNYNVTQLVTELRGQAEALGIVYEICLLDDASEESFRTINGKLIQKTNVRYQELPQNVGRATIRNRLVEMAKYGYLLFMDCDSGVVMPNYLKIYVEHLSPDRLLYGGRAYLPKPPADPQYLLHWHYGRQREQQDFLERQKNPYHAFMTNNFLIPRSLAEQIQFEESIRTYGHEDTLFGMELARHGIEIMHLHNPLLHLGLEPRDIFLEKTRMAVYNLAQLQHEGKVVETRLNHAYQRLQKWKMSKWASWVLKTMRLSILHRLQTQSQPNLRWLDLYKLDLFIEAMARQR